jgi:hypothetical protein
MTPESTSIDSTSSISLVSIPNCSASCVNELRFSNCSCHFVLGCNSVDGDGDGTTAAEADAVAVGTTASAQVSAAFAHEDGDERQAANTARVGVERFGRARMWPIAGTVFSMALRFDADAVLATGEMLGDVLGDDESGEVDVVRLRLSNENKRVSAPFPSLVLRALLGGKSG